MIKIVRAKNLQNICEFYKDSVADLCHPVWYRDDILDILSKKIDLSQEPNLGNYKELGFENSVNSYDWRTQLYTDVFIVGDTEVIKEYWVPSIRYGRLRHLNV